MDKHQRFIQKTFSRKQLENMTIADLSGLVAAAGPGVTFSGTAVVRRADGSIKYDKDAQPGNYGETQEELAAQGNS